MPRKYVTVDGVATLVHHRGPTTLPGRPPDTSRGEVVVCLHDAGGNGNAFAPLLDALGERHSPLSFDQPGHGRSGSLDSLGSVRAMADFTASLVAELGLANPVLLGDGLGAAVALEAAISGPIHPAALVLCGGATAHPELPDGTIDQLRSITSGKARREFDTTGYAPDTPRPVYEAAFAEWIKTDPRATLGDREAQAAWDARDRLDGVACPVLVVVGAHEEPEHRAAAEALAAGLADAKVVVLPDAGRRGVIEQPAALAGIVEQFLAESKGAVAR